MPNTKIVSSVGRWWILVVLSELTYQDSSGMVLKWCCLCLGLKSHSLFFCVPTSPLKHWQRNFALTYYPLSRERQKWDFPGGTVGKNLPANAGDTGSIPGPGRPHMPCGLRLCAATSEAHCLESVLWHKGSHCNEKPVRSNEDPVQPKMPSIK